jgi:hypothetical protein
MFTFGVGWLGKYEFISGIRYRLTPISNEIAVKTYMHMLNLEDLPSDNGQRSFECTVSKLRQDKPKKWATAKNQESQACKLHSLL